MPASADLERSRRELERSAAAESFSRSQRWPRLDLVGSASGTQVGTSIGVITNLPTFGDLSLGIGQNGYAVIQSLFAGGGVVFSANLLPISEGWQVAAAESGRLAANRQLSENERQVRFELESTYRELQLRQALVPVWETALLASSALERDVSQIFSKGLAARIDVLRARALRASDSQGLITARAQKEATRGRLAELLGLPPAEAPEAADPIRDVARPWPLGLEATLERALADRPLLEALRLQEQASRQRAKAARASLLPSLSLLAGAGINTNRIDLPVLETTGQVRAGPANVTLPTVDTPGHIQGNFYDWGGLLQLRQPLFDGGRARDGAALADREAAVLAADADLARRRIRTSVREAWEQVQASPARIAAAREAVAAGMRALRDAQLRYQAQVEPLTEVLLVQRELQASQAALLTAQTDQALGRALLAREIGGSPQEEPGPKEK
jgi:outer membrane protein TolC